MKLAILIMKTVAISSKKIKTLKMYSKKVNFLKLMDIVPREGNPEKTNCKIFTTIIPSMKIMK